MPRMFDILRGKAESQKDKTNGQAAKDRPEGRINFPQLFLDQREKINDGIEYSNKIIDIIKKKDVDNPELAKERCMGAVSTMDEVLNKLYNGEEAALCNDKIFEIVDVLTNQLILGDNILGTAAEQYSLDNYLSRHLVNVCILSLAIAIQMNFNKSKLHALGIAAIIHDIGMLGVKHISEQPRKLSEDEFAELKMHTLKGAEIALKMEGGCDIIIGQHHERVNGGGYPLQLKGNEIDNYAKIIGLADTYEAMTHHRPYRRAIAPHYAIREITGPFKLFFDQQMIKLLVYRISIFPLGSFVRLNSGDIARVIASNANSPLRPVVLVMLDSREKPLSEYKTLDLSKNNSVYIKEPLMLGDIS